MSAQHTPGPWLVSHYRVSPGRIVAPAAHADRPFGGSADLAKHRARCMGAVAFVPDEQSRHWSAAESGANANLIAAAPDLFAALKDLLDGEGDVHDKVLAARAAIAKAEGQ